MAQQAAPLEALIEKQRVALEATRALIAEVRQQEQQARERAVAIVDGRQRLVRVRQDYEAAVTRSHRLAHELQQLEAETVAMAGFVAAAREWQLGATFVRREAEVQRHASPPLHSSLLGTCWCGGQRSPWH